jgi:3-oxoacyl-[acyl-carrier-protein] synthase-3
MSIRSRPRSDSDHRDPTFAIREAGRQAFTTQGVEVPPRLALGLLQKHGITSDQVALVTHESSKRLIEAWAERLRPAEYPDHLATLGDVPGCSVPLTLSMCESTLRSPYIVLMSPGTGVHFAVLLLRRVKSN